MTSNDYIQIYQSNLKESPHNPNIHYIQYYLFSQWFWPKKKRRRRRRRHYHITGKHFEIWIP